MVTRPVPECCHGQYTGSLRTARRRRGFTLLELVIAMILLGVVFTVSLSMLAVVAREKRSTEQRQFALQHATNLLERATMSSWSNLSVGPQELSPPTDQLRSYLPNLERRVEVSQLKQDDQSKLVTVAVRWTNRAGQTIAPVRLSAWVYPTQEAAP